MRRFRFFPWVIYLYVFGAAGFGFGVSELLHEPGRDSLIVLGVSSIACTTAFFLMRPFMRLAKNIIAEMASERAALRKAEVADDASA